MEPALWAFGRKANMESNFCRQVLITRNQHISNYPAESHDKFMII